MSSGPGDAAGRLFAAVQAAAMPSEVVMAWTDADAEPVVGQLWRAAWEGAAEMVLLVSVDAGDRTDAPRPGRAGGSVRVLPVTVDVAFADERTAVLPGKVSSVGVPLAAWTGLVRDLPLFVLDRFLGQVDAHWVQPDELLAAAHDGRAGVGTAVQDVVDSRNEYRARLTDAFDELAGASWAPHGQGNLGKLLTAAGLGPAEVAQKLAVRPQDALSLLRGQLPVTAEQAGVVAHALGVPEVEVLATNPAPPADLVSRLDQPRRRRQLQALAERGQTDERTARLSAAYGTWRMAARQTGGQSAPAWDERLDRFFAVTLADPSSGDPGDAGA